jgi:DNA polymerase-3 subunit alpha/error-prone DNA polymerase
MLILFEEKTSSRGTMFFGTWVDHEGTYFDTTHFSDNLLQYPFQDWRLSIYY